MVGLTVRATQPQSIRRQAPLEREVFGLPSGTPGNPTFVRKFKTLFHRGGTSTAASAAFLTHPAKSVPGGISHSAALNTPSAHLVQKTLHQMYPRETLNSQVAAGMGRYERTIGDIYKSSQQLFNNMTPEELSRSLRDMQLFSNLSDSSARTSLSLRPLSGALGSNPFGASDSLITGAATRHLDPRTATGRDAIRPANHVAVMTPGVPVRRPDGSVVHPSVLSLSLPYLNQASSPEHLIYSKNGYLNRSAFFAATAAAYDSAVTAARKGRPDKVWMTELLCKDALQAWCPSDRAWAMSEQARLAAATVVQLGQRVPEVAFYGEGAGAFVDQINAHLHKAGRNLLTHVATLPRNELKDSHQVWVPNQLNSTPGDPREPNEFSVGTALHPLQVLSSAIHNGHLRPPNGRTIAPQKTLQTWGADPYLLHTVTRL
jgi:hypothetical protein